MHHGIPECGADEKADVMYAALDKAGCLVLRDALSEESVATVRSELAPHMDAAGVQPDDPTAFYPGLTRRAVGLAQRSPTVRDQLLVHPAILSLCDLHLLGNCTRYQLHVTAALEVGPGARDQVLHREEDPFPFFPAPRPNLVLATMWAMSDFTVDNGGTQLVPGSHRWAAERTAEPDEIVRAEMPAGSVLVWLGGTLHGAGANVTEGVWRYGVVLTYSLGWLRQEENQHLSVPLADALAMSEPVRNLLGFGMDYEGALGFYDPSVLLSR
ncbi:MAG TPA: phytanoyl-CoA dioxygenase family protein [Acidimicrobiales bacterium]|nr:phytanoyl-CoA dioxygenase family protein [Acidimicrobiales bacterium]